jgi:hypothetical protein
VAKPIKVSEPNLLIWFGFLFLENTKNRTKPNELRVHRFRHWINQKPIQTGPITPLLSTSLSTFLDEDPTIFAVSFSASFSPLLPQPIFLKSPKVFLS